VRRLLPMLLVGVLILVGLVLAASVSAAPDLCHRARAAEGREHPHLERPPALHRQGRQHLLRDVEADESALLRDLEPTPGLEPGTPSLRGKSQRATGVSKRGPE
jgi:hypothetical protein